MILAKITSLVQKQKETLFSWSWPPYCRLVIYHGPIYEFFGVLKKIKFLLKIER
jgi:hypothetical protein